jgi:hypothetical protein
MLVSPMDNLRQLLVAIAALTLLFSAVSGANPNYFAGYSAFGDDEEDDGEDNSGSSNEDKEDHDDSGRHESDDKNDEHTVTATFGNSSTVELGIDNEVGDDESSAGSVEADLQVETDDQDLPDGDHDVSLACETPAFEKAFDSPMEVEGGDGEFSGELLLVNGTTYENCVVSIGDMDVELPDFTVLAVAADEDDAAGSDDDDDEEDDDENGRGHEDDTGLETEGGKVQLEVEVETNMTDGTYDAKFTCEEPAVDMTIEDGFKVEDGEGKLKAELDLADGTYSGCKVESGDELIASFDSFAVKQEDEDDEEDHDDDVDQKRAEKRRDIVSRINAGEEHKRRMNASPASTGDFDPGWNYTLVANGTASPRSGIDSDSESVNASALTGDADVQVNLDMSVWKSNDALILLSVLNGTVMVDDNEYTIELGYALYSVSHDAMRIGAFVSDDDGNIYKLKLRGTATGEDAEFPTASGESIEMVFEGNSGAARNSISGWELDLEGTVEAE